MQRERTRNKCRQSNRVEWPSRMSHTGRGLLCRLRPGSHGDTTLVWMTALAAACVLTLSGAHGAGLLIADGGFGGVLEIKEHDVKVVINNGIAVTRVRQVFVNTENRQVEALYTFPVPKGASVANFSMWINGKEMVGEVVEKQRAREIYNSYKRVRRDPGLLEQTDYKTFEMRIFPIGPKAEQRVEVAYYQELEWDHDWLSYVYPLATVTRKNIQDRTTGKFAIDIECRSSIPITEMDSPSHGADLVTVNHTPEYAQASLETKAGSLQRDVVLNLHLVRPRTGFDLITSKNGREDGHFCLMLTLGKELAKKKRGMDYVFILDVSGSMNHDAKLRISRGSVAEFVDILDDEDRFEIVAFNVSPTSLFNGLRSASPEARTTAAEFLNSQKARGGTVLNPAIRTAYRLADPDRSLNVIILSDGMTEQRERTQLHRLIGERPGGTRVFCIGVGNEVNRPLLRQIADDAGGLAAFISREDDFRRKAKAFRRKLLRPVASNLDIQFAGGSVYDVEPERLPDLYHGTPVRIYGRYRKTGTATVTLKGDVGNTALKKSLRIKLPEQDPSNPEIERMWAWHRIQQLLKEADRQGNRKPVIDHIVRLGEGYSIASEYTSFIVLENDAEYRRWKIDRRNATRLERDRKAQQRLRKELDRLRSNPQAGIGPQQPTQTAPPPTKQAAKRPQTRSSRPATAQPTRRRQGWDLDIGGGGAVDPFTGALVGLIGLTALLGARSRKRTEEQ